MSLQAVLRYPKRLAGTVFLSDLFFSLIDFFFRLQSRRSDVSASSAALPQEARRHCVSERLADDARHVSLSLC